MLSLLVYIYVSLAFFLHVGCEDAWEGKKLYQFSLDGFNDCLLLCGN